MSLVFKQVCAEGGCNSFVIGDSVSGKACIIDPRADQQEVYEAFLTARKLSAVLVIDTHTHADHYSGSHLVASKLGARIAMSVATGSARAELRLSDGQTVEIGGTLAVRALATPGHTPDSVTLVIEGAWGQAAFTGDTLFIGGSGRTDFPGADPGAQYDSLHGKLGALPGATWVLPGHDYSGLLFSTIAHEKKTNPHLAMTSRDEFIAMKNAETLDSPFVLPNVLNFNLEAIPNTQPRAGVVTTCATACVKTGLELERADPAGFRQWLAERRAQGAVFIDVREPEEFARTRIEGLINIPLSELMLHWKALASASGVYLVCERGNRSLVAAETLRRLGLAKVGDLAGGTLAWVAAQLPTVRS